MVTLIDLYKIFSPSGGEKPMKKYIKRWIKTNVQGCTITHDQKGNIYVTKGKSDTYPCVVSHVDQVQRCYSTDYTVGVFDDVLVGYSQENKRFEGLGADDKNGIWVCLKCLQKFDVMKCAFFVEEEIGCGGSNLANFEWFNDCRFVLQCDRKGSSDLITRIGWTDLCSEEFLNDINYDAYGYRPTNGLMTDVETLKDNGVNLCMLNISCGYYEPHTCNEFTVFPDLENCLAFVENIIETCTDVYEHKFEYELLQRSGSTLQVGDVISKNYNRRDFYDYWNNDYINELPTQSESYYMEEYDNTYDSVWSLYQDNPYLTADDVWNAYKDCFFFLTYQDIEEMVNEIKRTG